MDNKPEQKTIEQFFDKYGVQKPDDKAKILPMVTDIIYDYNMHVVEWEKETDDYRKKQIETEMKELEDKIDENFCDILGICQDAPDKK